MLHRLRRRRGFELERDLREDHEVGPQRLGPIQAFEDHPPVLLDPLVTLGCVLHVTARRH
ncbi:MAG: hypothetical protein QF541_18980 [Lentisphaeria bacterium]|nr:hypothetical protein [Lentisphaeria bacterium]